MLRFALVLPVLVSCAPAAPRPIDPDLTSVSSSSAAPTEAVPSFDLPDGVERARLASSHPVGRFEAVVRTSPSFAYGDPRRGSPEPGVLVAADLVHPGSSDVALRYVMRREAPGFFPEGGDWRYAVLGSDGSVQKQGKLTLCARCHAEAPRDHLFERGAAKIAR